MFTDETMLDSRRKDPPVRQEIVDTKPPILEPEIKKESILGKRPAETPENVVEAKKPCIVKEPPLEDDLSEISDDADEILNRDEVNMLYVHLLHHLFILSINIKERERLLVLTL